MSDDRPVSAPFYSKDQLDYLGEQHAEAFSRLDGKANPGFSAWKFAVYYMGKEVRFEWLSNNGSVLGLSSFTAGTRVPIYVPEENGVEWQELGPDTILLSKLFEDAFLDPGKARTGCQGSVPVPGRRDRGSCSSWSGRRGLGDCYAHDTPTGCFCL